MQIPVNYDYAGFFIPEISGGARGTIQLPTTKNMILNAGIVRLLTTGTNVLQYISVGTGSSPPSETQSALDQRIATTNRNQTTNYGYTPIQNAPEAFGQTVFSVQFARGQAAGNLTEVAVGWTSDGSVNWSRALFRDSLGAPTAITIKDDEFFRVTYVLVRYEPTEWTGLLGYDDDGLPATTQVTIKTGTNTTNVGNGSGGNQRNSPLYITSPIVSQNAATFGESPQFNQLKWRVFFDLDHANPALSRITIGHYTGTVPNLIPAGTTIDFDPPIPKTNEFDLTIDLLLTLARRVP